jgi:integrase/recombinase XerD
MTRTLPLTTGAINALYEGLKKHHEKYTLLTRLTLETGYRVSDVLAARLVDIRGNRLCLRESKTGKARNVEISMDTMKYIHEYMRRYHLTKGSALIYSREDARKRPLTRVRAWQVIREAGRDVGVTVSPHALRKTYAVNLYQATGNLRIVQQALNHDRIETTAVYVFAHELSRF